MALPIKETPVLKGSDAKRFRKLMSQNDKISQSELNKIKSDFDKLDKIAKF